MIGATMSKRKGILGGLGLGLILAVGIAVVWAIAVIWGSVIAYQFLRGRQVDERLYYLADGTPFIETSQRQAETYRTLDGQAIPNDSPSLDFRTYMATMRGPKLPRRGLELNPWRQRILAFSDGRRPPTYWYLIHDARREGTGYLVGYNSATKRQIGYIGRQGFRPDMPPPQERFPVNGRRLTVYDYSDISLRPYGYGQEPRHLAEKEVYLISRGQLLKIDARNRTVQVALESPDLLSLDWGLRGLSSLPTEESERILWKGRNLLVRMKDRMLVLDPRQGGRRSYGLPEEIRGVDFDFLELADGRALATVGPDYGWGTRTYRLFWFDEAGKVLRREEAVLKTPAPVVAPEHESWAFAAALPAPIALTASAAVIGPLVALAWGEEPTYARALAGSLSKAWPVLLATCLVAAMLAWVCFRRQRRFAAPGVWAWTIFVFLFGVPGLLAYLVYRTWPARLPCQSCGDPSPRDREACSVCGTDFPEPAPQGIEVLA